MQNTLPERLKASHVLIITHVYGTGPPQDLEEYLREKVASLLLIGHPFPYASDRRSFWRRYERGRLQAQGTAVNWRGPELVFYLKDAVLTMYWSWRHGGAGYNLIVGAGGFDAVMGLMVRRLGRAGKVVFYCIDWVPQRFKNRWLNGLYHWFDRRAVMSADRTWNLSARMSEERARRGIHSAKQLVVPVGIWQRRFPRRRPAASRELAVIYLGHLRAGQGLPLLFKAWPAVVDRCPSATLHLVGDGPLRHELQAGLVRTGRAETVIWHGFLSDHRQVEEQLVQGDVAVAMYEPGTFTQYTDPGKLKVYLAAGLPIVMTNIGSMAGIIEQQGAGLVIPYEQTALVKSLLILLTDRERREQMGEAARQLAKQYDWETLFPQAIEQTL